MDILTCIICQYLLNVKNYFLKFFDLLFELLKNPPLHNKQLNLDVKFYY